MSEVYYEVLFLDLNRDQNLPSLLFLPNCLFMKLQLFVSAYMNALWIHSKNCCKYITHTYACIGSPERNKSTYICYSPVGRSVLGKTVPSALSTQERGHSFSQYGPTLGWRITFYILLHKWVLIYIHKVFWNIPEAYKRTILTASTTASLDVSMNKQSGDFKKLIFTITITHNNIFLPNEVESR